MLGLWYWLQVLHFVVSHVDVFISILQDRQAVPTCSSLQELGLVTGIMCNMGLTEAVLMADEELGQEQIQLRGPLARIQRLTIGLLPRYCSSDHWDKVCFGHPLSYLRPALFLFRCLYAIGWQIPRPTCIITSPYL